MTAIPVAIPVAIPGAFWCFLTGTGVYQGDVWSHEPVAEAAARRLERALKNDVVCRKVGKGESFIVPLDAEAAAVLWEYADTCEDAAYFGDGATSETAAAKKLKARLTATFGFTFRYEQGLAHPVVAETT